MENKEEPYFESERISELGWSFEDKASSPPSKSNCISDNVKNRSGGGECQEIGDETLSSNGGPGLPVSGFFKTNV